MSPTELSELMSMKVEMTTIQTTLANQDEDSKEHSQAVKDLAKEVSRNGTATAVNTALLENIGDQIAKLDGRQWSIWSKSAGWGGLGTGVIALITAVIAML